MLNFEFEGFFLWKMFMYSILVFFMFFFVGNEDEEVDNEMCWFVVFSYIDLFEKFVLLDILVWIICWVSLIIRLYLCCMLLFCSLWLVVFSYKWWMLLIEKVEYKKVLMIDLWLVLDWYFFFFIFLSWVIFELRFFLSEEMVESVFWLNV